MERRFAGITKAISLSSVLRTSKFPFPILIDLEKEILKVALELIPTDLFKGKRFVTLGGSLSEAPKVTSSLKSSNPNPSSAPVALKSFHLR